MVNVWAKGENALIISGYFLWEKEKIKKIKKNIFALFKIPVHATVNGVAGGC